MKKIVFSLVVLAFVSCTKAPPSPPGEVQLVYPNENLECTTGTVLNNNLRQINFKWAPTKHADAYRINIIDVKTKQSYSSTTSETSIDYSLNTGKAYAWKVIASNSEVIETSESPLWHFFVAGATSSHIPYPAVAKSPEMGSYILMTDTGQLNLQWVGVDSDGDISKYSLFFDTVNPPLNQETLASHLSTNHIVTITSNTTYYWQVKIEDSKGNQSESAVFDFKVK